MIARAAVAGSDFDVVAVLARPGRDSVAAHDLPTAQVVHAVSELAAPVDFAIEVAGPAAVAEVCPALLAMGIETAIASTGALADDDLRERLEELARKAGTRLRLLPGAVGGLDILGAHKLAGLTRVNYTGRKPPAAWKGADICLDVTSETIVFQGTARQAARAFPANANVAATIALAGLGFDQTTVTLVADPALTYNVHGIEAESAAGFFRLEAAAWPLPGNKSTSAVTGYSALRTLNALTTPLYL
jgi:aspartate dehydrogenase